MPPASARVHQLHRLRVLEPQPLTGLLAVPASPVGHTSAPGLALAAHLPPRRIANYHPSLAIPAAHVTLRSQRRHRKDRSLPMSPSRCLHTAAGCATAWNTSHGRGSTCVHSSACSDRTLGMRCRRSSPIAEAQHGMGAEAPGAFHAIACGCVPRKVVAAVLWHSRRRGNSAGFLPMRHLTPEWEIPCRDAVACLISVSGCRCTGSCDVGELNGAGAYQSMTGSTLNANGGPSGCQGSAHPLQRVGQSERQHAPAAAARCGPRGALVSIPRAARYMCSCANVLHIGIVAPIKGADCAE